MKSLEGFSYSFGRGLKFAAAALVIFATGILSSAEPVTITASVVGKGVVLGNGTFESGTQITLRAAPQVDWRFDHWEGVPASDSQSNPITLTAGPGLHPVAVMVASDGSGRFAGGPIVSYNATVPVGLTS